MFAIKDAGHKAMTPTEATQESGCHIHSTEHGRETRLNALRILFLHVTQIKTKKNKKQNNNLY